MAFDLKREKAKEKSWLHEECSRLNADQAAAASSYPHCLKSDSATGQKIIWRRGYYEVVVEGSCPRHSY